MTIAELFVSIGLKGTDKTQSGLRKTKAGVEELRASSLATKAAIAGMVIGLERLTGFASQLGTDLYKFGVTTGLSTEELQKWQYAAMKFDVTGEEMANTIQSVQTAIAEMKLGRGQPELLGLLKVDPSKLDDTFYVMDKVEDFIKSVKDPAIARSLAKSLGISDNVFQALKAMNRERDKPTRFQIITDTEKAKLLKVNSEWKDFWFNLKMVGTHFVSQFGSIGIEKLSGAFKALQGITGDVMKLAKAFPVLQEAAVAAGIAIAAVFAPITTAISGLVLLLSDIQKYREGKESVTGTLLGNGTMGEKIGKLSDMSQGTFLGPVVNLITAGRKALIPDFVPPAGMQAAIAGMPSGDYVRSRDSSGNMTPMSVTQNQNFYGAADPKVVKKAAKNGISEAQYQNQANSRTE